MKKFVVNVRVALDVCAKDYDTVEKALEEMDYNYTFQPDSGVTLDEMETRDWEIDDVDEECQCVRCSGHPDENA